MFINDTFLLGNKSAERLYSEYAANLPIIDYHCHLPADRIAGNYVFENITAAWLEGDHYKWRAMRANGVPEHYITGEASDREKFDKWAETVPMTVGNPLYHWTHMELKSPFGISTRLLSPDTADAIWEECNRKLARPQFSARGLIAKAGVEIICTTDDPTDSLEHHKAILADQSFKTRVLPTFRPDRALAVEDTRTFNRWVAGLAEAADMEIKDYQGFISALRKRHDYFHSNGCRLSDHAMETPVYAEATDAALKYIFRSIMRHRAPTPEEAAQFKTAVLRELAVMNFEKSWTQQFHIGALRNVNSRMMRILGPDAGFDAIADGRVARPLAAILDRLERDSRLARTIVYNLNPRDNELIAALVGCFQDGSIAGRIQLGSAWWFMDQKDGIERLLTALSNLGLLSRFVGMLTDSRSFLSYSRHDYFRRILCNMLGAQIEAGLAPRDWDLMGGLVQRVCYGNAREYFGF